MVNFRDEDEGGSEVEFTHVDIEHYRTVNKNNEIKPNEPIGDNYNRSDRLSIDLSPRSRPELNKEEYRALDPRVYWQLFWDGKQAYKIRVKERPRPNEDPLEYYDIKNGKAPITVANKNLSKKTIGHVIVLTTEKGGDSEQHTAGCQGFVEVNGQLLESKVFEYKVKGAW